MIRPNLPAIDMDEIIAKIQAEVDRRRRLQNQCPTPPETPAGGAALVDRNQFTAALLTAESCAKVGTVLPAMRSFRGLKRRAAQYAARAVLYAAQVVTVPQRQFNAALLQALRALARPLRRVEDDLARHAAEIQALRAELAAFGGTLAAGAQGDPRPVRDLFVDCVLPQDHAGRRS